ncbi:DUF4215 domain-containing protein [Candidatus Peribacteria bacterium]|nr:DUF4215 domain-containing protein [Candidatus Peribacteria bacterium]
MSHADGVCGDLARDDGEQCDDGNLSNGDSCSNVCTLERCGNATVDAEEQCDDGNALAGDGCSDICRIEFCGDSVIESQIGEQCDDGNRLSGDGCSSLCKSENQAASSSSSVSSEASTSSESTSSSASESHQAAPDETPELTNEFLALPIAPQATQAVTFILSPDSEDYQAYMTEGQQDQLLQIMHKIESGTPLTEQERVWATELLAILTAARAAERTRYTDLLRQFITTPISADVVMEKELTEDRLIDVTIPVAMDELKQAISIIERGELRSRVLLDIEKLRRQGIDIELDLPTDYASVLGEDARSVNVFEMLKTIKEATEKHATTDLTASLEIIRIQMEILRDALPLFEREYGLDPVVLFELLDQIQAATQDTTKQETDRVIAAVHRLLTILERRNVIAEGDLSLELGESHPAAAHSSLIPLESNVDALAESAPPLYKDAFEEGDIEAQKASLLRFLDTNERLQRILVSLPEGTKQEFAARFAVLRQQIAAVGTEGDAESVCDDSMSDALACSAEFLSDTQEAARSANLFLEIIGKLQDYFGIGQ